MIGSIRGVLRNCDYPTILLETQSGLGYEVDVPMGVLHEGLVDQEVLLYTHLVVREDVQMLFGFTNTDMRYVFRDLIKISGVGPKVAMMVLSSISIEDLRSAVELQDTKLVMQVKGIGKRVAEKMLIELKGKVEKWPVASSTGSQPIQSAQSRMYSDAMDALLGLGYPKKQAEKALAAVQGEASDLTEWVRLALKQMAMPQTESIG